MEVIRRLIYRLLKEEIGRNFHTINTEPITFRDFQDYDVEINPVGKSRYSLDVFFKNKKVAQTSTFKDFEEANNFARRIIDAHRVKVMNSSQ